MTFQVADAFHDAFQKMILAKGALMPVELEDFLQQKKALVHLLILIAQQLWALLCYAASSPRK